MSSDVISNLWPANPLLPVRAPRAPTDPFLIAADLFDPPALAGEGEELKRASWHLEPHQIPPAGLPGVDWFLWLLLGGRGAGKTQACAAYMHAHAIGPPCLEGPMPHRMAIIAPTLGDASESCVNGPSGLRAHNPAIVEITRRGGTFVNWPNGAQARLFGAYTQQEPERLRAGGNRCAAAGTLVATEHGQIPIEAVRAGMRVWTRNGLRRVLRAGQTGVRDCIELHADGRTLRLTADHEVWTGARWEPSGLARRVTAWRDPTSSGTESAGTSARTATSRRVGAACCTGPSTPPSTVRSRPASTFTTRTSTSPTTTRRTSSPAPPAGTGASITPSAARTGTSSEGSPPPPRARSAATPAPSAARRSSIAAQGPPSSARRSAETAARRHERSPNGCASCAATGSPPPSAGRPRLAVIPVERATSPISSGPEPVYDLLVEHDHEFFANGFLVANCLVWAEEIAAWRYLAECWKHVRLGLLRLGATPHAIASTTPRNRPTMKTLIALAESTNSKTHGTTDQNPHLPAQIRGALYKDYGNTRLGRQELAGEMIEDVVGALWTPEQLEQCRIREQDAPAERQRLIIAVDPSWGTTGDEVGILAGFRGPDDRVYIVEDLSGVMTPSAWGVLVAKAYERLSADQVIAEGNFQGEQVRLVMKTAHVETDIRVNFKLVTASRGKVLRAEPVVALYEQGRVRHVGRHVGLEHQMTHWVPPRNADGSSEDKGDPEPEQADPAGEAETSEQAIPSDYSPDRVDALVFLVTELLLGAGGPGQILIPAREGTAGRRLSGRGRW